MQTHNSPKKIVLLVGPSSAGKSTLCQELKRNHQWRVVGQDEVREVQERKETKEDEEKRKTEQIKAIEEEIKRLDIFLKLSKFMKPDEIIKLCTEGSLTITAVNHRKEVDNKCITHQFASPDFEDMPVLLEKLKAAGFNTREITFFKLTIFAIGGVFKRIDRGSDLMSDVFNQAFQAENDPRASVVIDVVPWDAPDEIIKQFNKRADQYRLEHPTEEISTFTVLAHATPQLLSARIKSRNEEAVKENNPKDLRQGLFPFHQLGILLKTQGKSSESSPSLGKVSRDELLKLSHEHRRPARVIMVSEAPKMIQGNDYFLVRDKEKGSWELHFMRKQQIITLNRNSIATTPGLELLNPALDKLTQDLAERKPEDVKFLELINYMENARKIVNIFDGAQKGVVRFKRIAETVRDSVSLSKSFGLSKDRPASEPQNLAASSPHFDTTIDTVTGKPSKQDLAQTLLTRLDEVQINRDALKSTIGITAKKI